jgi:ribosome-binding factor A
MRHKKAIPNRSFRVADQIQREVAGLIRELKDPRVGLLTINSVDVTPDYAHAKVYFSLLLGDTAACEAALNEAAGYLRNALFKRLTIHTVPTLHFQFDRTTERALELSALIDRANATRTPDVEAEGGSPPSATPHPETPAPDAKMTKITQLGAQPPEGAE